MTYVHQRTAVVVAAAAFITLAMAGCGGVSISIGNDDVNGSGPLVTTTFELDDFDSVEVRNSFDVSIRVGETPYVEVTTNENLVDELDVDVRNGELRIGLQDGISLRRGTLEAIVHLPDLNAVEVSGASSVEVVGASNPTQRYTISGASELLIEGTATEIDVEASGASDVDVRLMGVDRADVEVSGASSVELRSATRVVGDVSGASDVTVPEDAIVDVDTSGASDVNRS